MRKILILLVVSTACYAQSLVEKHEMQLLYALKAVEKARAKNPALMQPRSVRADSLFLVPSHDWTSGFFPGNLWLMYELTGKAFWQEKALENTLPLEPIKLRTGTHDLGFMMYCSFGNAYRFTSNDLYKEILMVTAETLIKRFDPTVGCIRSWDFNKEKWQYPVIIDNMMNLELLFWASKASGNAKYKEIAIKHALTTMKNHYREDGSSYHVISYNPATGAVEKRNTHQGFSDASAWARGQAWGLYGFSMCYRETGDGRFLNKAREIGKYLLNHPNTPADKVPYWDYNDLAIPYAPRDVSAAAIIASALFELSKTVIPEAKAFKIRAAEIMSSIHESYLSPYSTNFGFLTDHSTGHLPGKHEVDTPIIYADYYYLEALIRMND